MANPSAPHFSSADFASALMALMPSGPVWPRDSDAVMPRVLGALTPTYERETERGADLLQEAPGRNLDELLPEWEATLGLPDPCHGPDPTLAQRQASVLAAIAARGGQSKEYFTKVAAALGFVVTIQNYAPARFGKWTFADPMQSTRWAHAWSVTGPLAAVRVPKFGELRFGVDRFREWGYPVLECVLRELAPAHTELFFIYTGSGPDLLDVNFTLDESLMT